MIPKCIPLAQVSLLNFSFVYPLAYFISLIGCLNSVCPSPNFFLSELLNLQSFPPYLIATTSFPLFRSNMLKSSLALLFSSCSLLNLSGKPVDSDIQNLTFLTSSTVATYHQYPPPRLLK